MNDRVKPVVHREPGDKDRLIPRIRELAPWWPPERKPKRKDEKSMLKDQDID